MSVLKFLMIVVLGTIYFFSTCFCVQVTTDEFNNFNLLCNDEWKGRTNELCQKIGEQGGKCMNKKMNVRKGNEIKAMLAKVPVCWDSSIQAQKCITGHTDSNDALIWKHFKINRNLVGCEPETVRKNLLKEILESENKTDAAGSSNADAAGSSIADE